MSETGSKDVRIIAPQSLSGDLTIQPSKSAGHRMLVCAALAEGISVIHNPGASQDIEATAGALASLGLAILEKKGDSVQVIGRGGRSVISQGIRIADCAESGSTLRFLIPLALDGTQTEFTGRGRLMERPMELYRELFAQRGWLFEQGDGLIRVRGQLAPDVFRLRGDVSSQFITGLLFALPLLADESRIELTTPLESRGYVDLTLEAMDAFGVRAVWEDAQTLVVPGGQRYAPTETDVEGDFSHAAFYLVAGAIGSQPAGIACRGLKAATKQGDRAIVDVLRAMGARIEQVNGTLTAVPSKLHGTVIDASQIPDLVPILTVAACAAEGETRIERAGRLRIKESDRLSAMAQELTKLGGDVCELPDGLVIRGTGKLAGGSADSHGDHRVAMSMAVAAAICETEITLTGGDSVKKSAPRFWEEYAALGGNAIELGK